MKAGRGGQQPGVTGEQGLRFLAEMAAALAPGSGLADAGGMYYSPMGGQQVPGLLENAQAGNYGASAMQGLGLLGDAMWAGGPIAGATLGSVLKLPGAVSKAGKAVKGAKAAGKIGASIDMSQAARMARAQEQGYDTGRVLYHGGSSDFPAFADSRRGIWLSPEPEIASTYAEIAPRRWAGQNNANPNVMPVYVKGKPLIVSDLGPTPQHGGGYLSDNLAEALGVSLDGVPAGQRAQFLKNEARKQGYGYIEIRNLNDIGGMQTQIQVLDPANIRSINAKFDPSETGSSDLLSGIAAGLLGGGLLTGGVMSQQEAKTVPGS
jgi:hypothetical protein